MKTNETERQAYTNKQIKKIDVTGNIANFLLSKNIMQINHGKNCLLTGNIHVRT